MTSEAVEFGNAALVRMVAEHLPGGGSVLDVGCSHGGLLASLGDRAGRRVGIEVDATVAASARPHADDLHVAPFADAPIGDERFDVVVLGDVLEHQPDPVGSLRHCARWAGPHGVVVVSLPNVAHWSMRFDLMRGRWEYQDSGILDRTHLRFFTWSSGADLLDSAGLQILARRAIVPSLSTHLPVAIPLPARRAWQRVGHRWPGLFAYQQLLVGRPRGSGTTVTCVSPT